MENAEHKKTFTMPQEMFTKWIDALRSGDYEQGQGNLETNGKYCCLGVLQMVADGEVETATYSNEKGIFFKSVGLPSDYWAIKNGCRITSIDGEYESGFNPYLPSISSKNELMQCSSVNDDGVSFTNIADALERHYGGETITQ